MQEEAGSPEEAPKIARVIYNRLREGMAARHRRHLPLRRRARAGDARSTSRATRRTTPAAGRPAAHAHRRARASTPRGGAAPGRRPVDLLRAHATPASTSSPSHHGVRPEQGRSASRRTSAVADGGRRRLAPRVHPPRRASSARRCATRARRRIAQRRLRGRRARLGLRRLRGRRRARPPPPSTACGRSASAGCRSPCPTRTTCRRRSTALTADAAALDAVNCVGLGGRRAGGRQHRRRRASRLARARPGCRPGRAALRGARRRRRGPGGHPGPGRRPAPPRSWWSTAPPARAEAAAAARRRGRRASAPRPTLADADLVVNATSVGMGAARRDRGPIPWRPAPAGRPGRGRPRVPARRDPAAARRRRGAAPRPSTASGCSCTRPPGPSRCWTGVERPTSAAHGRPPPGSLTGRTRFEILRARCRCEEDHPHRPSPGGCRGPSG